MTRAALGLPKQRKIPGVQCPKCLSKSESFVIDSRFSSCGYRRRRYECGGCKFRFTTYELKSQVFQRMRTLTMEIQDILGKFE